MATYSIYDQTTNRNRQISVEFLGNVLADSLGTATDPSVRYYFRITTSARTTDGEAFPNQLVLDLDELVLNGVKQRRSNTAAAYTDITDMIEDYLFDMVNGHAANLHGSGVAARAPMAF